MVYAAELLRGDCADSAVRVLESEHIFGGALSEAASWVIEPRRVSVYERRKRLLRARLALLLRALLRADAGDYGQRWPRDIVCERHGFVTRITTDDHPRFYHCDRCSHEYRLLWSEEAQSRFVFARRYAVPVAPLWERAPSHERGTP
jgi:hypothetical protein